MLRRAECEARLTCSLGCQVPSMTCSMLGLGGWGWCRTRWRRPGSTWIWTYFSLSFYAVEEAEEESSTRCLPRSQGSPTRAGPLRTWPGWTGRSWSCNSAASLLGRNTSWTCPAWGDGQYKDTILELFKNLSSPQAHFLVIESVSSQLELYPQPGLVSVHPCSLTLLRPWVQIRCQKCYQLWYCLQPKKAPENVVIC